MFEARSITWSIAAPILMAVIATLVLGSMAFGWSLTRAIETGLRSEISLDIAAIRKDEDRLRVVAIADAIDHRIKAAPATSAGLYVLADRDGSAVVGNLDGIPDGEDDSDWIHFTAEAADGRQAQWLGRRQALPHGYTLFVARRSDGLLDIARQAAPALAITVLVSLAFVSVALTRTSRRVTEAVTELSGIITAARAGAPDRRVTSERQPREIQQLGMQVNVLLDTLQRQLGNMRRLSTQAAHELSSPLARVVTRLTQTADPVTIASCRQELQETLALLQALLDIAEHESEPGVLGEAVDLASVCAPVCDMYSDAAADRDIKLVRSLGHAFIRGEPSLLTRAVANLLDNAIKASPPGGEVTVATGVEAGLPFLSVADQGLGVGDRSVEDLLIAARTQPRAAGSHGLGLRFTRAIAIRHGAILTASRGTPSGSVFVITFPVMT